MSSLPTIPLCWDPQDGDLVAPGRKAGTYLDDRSGLLLVHP